VTNAVVGESRWRGRAGGARATAYRVVELGGKWVRLTQAMDGGYHLIVHKGGYGIVN